VVAGGGCGSFAVPSFHPVKPARGWRKQMGSPSPRSIRINECSAIFRRPSANRTTLVHALTCLCPDSKIPAQRLTNYLARIVETDAVA
jgi:hypothetical protein